MLTDLGLDDHAEHCYRALLGSGPAPVASLSDVSGLPQEVVEASVPVLLEHGLASLLPEQPPRIEAVDPEIAVAALVSRRRAQVDEAHRQIPEFARLFARESRRRVHTVELLQGHEVLNARIRQLTDAARHEVRCLDTPPYVESEEMGPSQVELAALRKGLRWRGIYSRAALEWPNYLDGAIKPLAVAGEESRFLNVVPVKLLLIDDQWAVVPISMHEPIMEAALIAKSAMFTAFDALFECLWRRATPITTANLLTVAKDDGNTRPTPRDRRILELLAAGKQDQAIARELGTSLRTVRRWISDLTTELDASTRFQAAYNATKRGWI